MSPIAWFDRGRGKQSMASAPGGGGGWASLGMRAYLDFGVGILGELHDLLVHEVGILRGADTVLGGSKRMRKTTCVVCKGTW